MQIPVLVEPIAGNGYRARGIEPFGFSAEGSTPAEALAKLKEQVEARVSAGVEIVSLEVGPRQHPWAPFAGMFENDADFSEVLDIMAENRRKMDADPDVP